MLYQATSHSDHGAFLEDGIRVLSSQYFPNLQLPRPAMENKSIKVLLHGISKVKYHTGIINTTFSCTLPFFEGIRISGVSCTQVEFPMGVLGSFLNHR